MNKLGNTDSEILKLHKDDPIDWYPWSKECLDRAKSEDKPIFLVSCALWCQECHEITDEIFLDPQIADLLNKNFVSVLLDRDEHPEVDRRYQESISVIMKDSGWPLIAFLTPEARAFYGFVYRKTNEEIGFKDIFERVLGMFKEAREKIEELSKNNEELIQKHFHTEPMGIDNNIIHFSVMEVLENWDDVSGSLALDQKFYFPSLFEVMVNQYVNETQTDTKEEIKKAVLLVLRNMAKGKIHDKEEGGFYRCSADEAWQCVREEKTTADNAELLRLYSRAFRTFVASDLKDIINQFKKYFSANESEEGGFYTSNAKIKGKRFVDKSIYTDVNSLVIEAFCESYLATSDKYFLESAVKTANMLLDNRLQNTHLMRSKTKPGILSDYAYFGYSLLRLFEITKEEKYLESSKNVIDMALNRFWNRGKGGFFEVESESGLYDQIEYLLDMPLSAPGPYIFMSMMELLRNFPQEIKYEYFLEEYARKLMGSADKNPIHSGSVLRALDVLINHPIEKEEVAFDLKNQTFN
ncbi:MAG TPA: thioredoxin domain-containing protein [Thermodesulfobium narugense]|nr:thioredoxin domain-containing protein [Thermodesulfobium narugense]